MFSVAISHLCCSSLKAVIDCMKTNEHDHVPIKLYLHGSRFGPWAIVCKFLEWMLILFVL